jgi:hypothetical protein
MSLLDKDADKKSSSGYYSSSFSKPPSDPYSASPGKGSSPIDYSKFSGDYSTPMSVPLSYGSIDPSMLPATETSAFDDYYDSLALHSFSSELGKGDGDDDDVKSKSSFAKYYSLGGR